MKALDVAAALERLARYVSAAELDRVIAAARAEDMGPLQRDATSLLAIPLLQKGQAVIRTRQRGCIVGVEMLPRIAGAYDANVTCELLVGGGAIAQAGAVVARLQGPMRSLLALERVALNFLTHLSGIATLTHRYVQAVANTKAKIYDTRKTIPGLRHLAKYAVVCGGGCSHRMGLHDAVLVKDNHLGDIPVDALTDHLRDLIAQARALTPPVDFVEVEVDTLDQLKGVLPAGPDVVLLDNFKLDQLRSAVSIRDKLAPGVQLEASGGVNLETVLPIARTGVDRIAIGALTHSAPALDLGMDLH
jgi:nicotinate-nucleotide pyrophosphorylase (carboxylating)